MSLFFRDDVELPPRDPLVGEEVELATATGLVARYRVLAVDRYEDGMRLTLTGPEPTTESENGVAVHGAETATR